MSSNSEQPDLPISLPPATGPLRERAASGPRYLVRYGYKGGEADFTLHGTSADLLDALEIVFRDCDVEAMSIRKTGA